MVLDSPEHETDVSQKSKSSESEKKISIEAGDLSSKKKRKKRKSDEFKTQNKTSVVARDILDAKDQGHRYGNFHDYYSFNPTQERMKLLEKSGGILDIVANHWITNQESSKQSPSESGVDRGEGIPATKKPKLDGGPSESTPASLMNQEASFSYLDVGCNEGDLTMEVAKALAIRLSGNIGDLDEKESSDDDARTKSASDRNIDESQVNGMIVNANGVDIDKELIRRANRKYKPNNNIGDASSIPIFPSFQVSNVLSNDFLVDQSDSHADNGREKKKKQQQFYFTSLFSTTMWVHIHGGDEGLRRALGNICRCTKSFVLVEPQPSKCYRSAMVRLRKMGLPEFDVSSERLQLRPNLGDALDNIFREHSFQRVVLRDLDNSNEEGTTTEKTADSKTTSASATTATAANKKVLKNSTHADKNKKGDKTRWKRSIWLYQRMD